MIHESVSLKYEPASVPQHISVKWSDPGILASLDSIAIGLVRLASWLTRAVGSHFGALYYTHIASVSHLTWKLISSERYENILTGGGQNVAHTLPRFLELARGVHALLS